MSQSITTLMMVIKNNSAIENQVLIEFEQKITLLQKTSYGITLLQKTG